MDIFSRRLVFIKKNKLLTFLFFSIILICLFTRKASISVTTYNEDTPKQAVVIQDSQIYGNVNNNDHFSPMKEENGTTFEKYLANFIEKLKIIIIFPENKHKKKTNFK